MAQEQQLPEIKLDISQLYREEIFTDRKAGTLRRLVPVLADGNADSSRPVLYSGQTQLLTPAGVLPLAFELEAASLEEAIDWASQVPVIGSEMIEVRRVYDLSDFPQEIQDAVPFEKSVVDATS